MKKTILKLLTLAMVLTLINGCNPAADNASENNSNPTEQESNTANNDSSAAENEKNDEAGSSFLPVVYKTTASEVIKNLGEPDFKGEEMLLGADGKLHQDWVYTNKGIKTSMARTEKETEYTVWALTIKDPCKLLIEGIGIGSTKEDVVNAHGSNIDQTISTAFSTPEKELILVGTIYDGIFFTIENGKVTEIFVGAKAE